MKSTRSRWGCLLALLAGIFLMFWTIQAPVRRYHRFILALTPGMSPQEVLAHAERPYFLNVSTDPPGQDTLTMLRWHQDEIYHTQGKQHTDLSEADFFKTLDDAAARQHPFTQWDFSFMGIVPLRGRVLLQFGPDSRLQRVVKAWTVED